MILIGMATEVFFCACLQAYQGPFFLFPSCTF
jgi:hypothetical protein